MGAQQQYASLKKERGASRFGRLRGLMLALVVCTVLLYLPTDLSATARATVLRRQSLEQTLHDAAAAVALSMERGARSWQEQLAQTQAAAAAKAAAAAEAAAAAADAAAAPAAAEQQEDWWLTAEESAAREAASSNDSSGDSSSDGPDELQMRMAQAAAALEAAGDAGVAAPAAAEAEEQQGEEAAEEGAADKEEAAQEAAESDGRSPYERALQGCESLACLKAAAEQPMSEGQFRFPHFYILGFPKCATTSLFQHLLGHPQVATPRIKEPNFLHSRCLGDLLSCPPREQMKYVTNTLYLSKALEGGLQQAVFEGSTHYAPEGQWLAPQLREQMPWIRLVLSMREPISRAISMVQHNMAKRSFFPRCYDQATKSIFLCIKGMLEVPEGQYAPQLGAWADAFPREQLFVLQYENLTSDNGMAPALRELKRFLSITPHLPSDQLGAFNHAADVFSEGWPMTLGEYEQLVQLARPDVDKVAALVRQHDFADADAWVANWQAEWDATLARCRKGGGKCRVFVR